VNASELSLELSRLERVIEPVITTLVTQDDQIDGLLKAQYNFTIKISELERENARLRQENADLWEQLNWKNT
jgi:predicted  nucleic acid-binding Zn-ribbon protein